MYNIFFVSCAKKRGMEEKLSLVELLEKVKWGIECSVSGYYWVVAEIGEISYNSRNLWGHCYLELIERSKDNSEIVSKVRATIWGNTFSKLRPYFENEAGIPLKQGIKVLVKAKVDFHVVYGISLNISDIEPSYSVGDLELLRQQTIERLKSEGCFNLNSQMEFKRLFSKIAIISADGAAGYGDFMKQINHNDYGIVIKTELFEAKMQGVEAPDSIIEALDRINSREDEFDAVVIIRGGGAKTDLLCFDDYNLAFNVAQFPLPVLTGVGHERDFHVIDMVAHTHFKTPTAVAAHLVSLIASEFALVGNLEQKLYSVLEGKIKVEHERLMNYYRRISNGVQNNLLWSKKELEIIEVRLNSASPLRVLERGYAIVSFKGSLDELGSGDKVKIKLKGGEVEFRIGEVLNKKIN